MNLIWQRRIENRFLHIASVGKSRDGMGIAKALNTQRLHRFHPEVRNS
jgi:hypothetical protein